VRKKAAVAFTPSSHLQNFDLRVPRKLLSQLDSGGIMASITHLNLIATVGQRGFWEEQQRVSKLQEKKPVLKRLSESNCVQIQPSIQSEDTASAAPDSCGGLPTMPQAAPAFCGVFLLIRSELVWSMSLAA
jgi:hypothetical protein